MLLSRFAQSAAALLLLTICVAAPVHAQQNKQIISGTFYEDRATPINSSTTGNLILTFAQTPANQFLNITNVSCLVEQLTAQTLTVMSLNAGSTSGAEDLGRPYYILGSAVPVTGGGTKFYSIVQNGMFYKFGPGRFPSIEIDSFSTGSFSTFASCIIVGNLSDN
jgi:hypothetical protein